MSAAALGGRGEIPRQCRFEELAASLFGEGNGVAAGGRIDHGHFGNRLGLAAVHFRSAQIVGNAGGFAQRRGRLTTTEVNVTVAEIPTVCRF